MTHITDVDTAMGRSVIKGKVMKFSIKREGESEEKCVDEIEFSLRHDDRMSPGVVTLSVKRKGRDNDRVNLFSFYPSGYVYGWSGARISSFKCDGFGYIIVEKERDRK